MKISLCLSSCPTVCYAQMRNDTVFLKRTIAESYHAIFIDTNKNSRFYTYLQENTNSSFDSAFYFSNIASLKNKKLLFKKNGLYGISSDWIPLNYFNHKYYVYIPSDGMYANWVKISDSTLFYYAGGEMLVQAINGVKWTGPGNISFISTGIDGKTFRTNIHIVDEHAGIAVFEYPDKAYPNQYELRVSSGKMRNFPIIVNYCLSGKQEELAFNKPDFKLLLRKQLRKTRSGRFHL